MIEILRNCPCCSAKDEFEEIGSYAICETCGWEDDPVQESDRDFAGGANIPSLNAAVKNFTKHGISNPEKAPQIRKLPG